MIEVVSHPADLATWDAGKHPFFYLELYGETRPWVDQTYAEVQPAGPVDSTSQQAVTATPLYRYWWTIGHGVAPQQLDEVWSHLRDDPAARVYLYFPLDKGWRIKELVATVQYLQPVHQQVNWWNQRVEDWKTLLAPLVANVGALASTIPQPMIAGAGSALSTIAKLQVNSVPQVDGFEWSVSKVTMREVEQGVMQGVMWTLPRKMFTELGSRLTGSLALSFIPSQRQGKQGAATGMPRFDPGDILAHTVVRGPDDDIWAPSQTQFVALRIHPQAAES